MALSLNYGWSEPDNSSLVKNGAADIRTLGDAIDTSVWNVGYGQAGKNKLINGDFTINQRVFTSTTTTAAYGFDRWALSTTDGTTTYSAQTFTAGAAPVAGYEATNFARVVSTGQTATNALSAINQAIENVRSFAGQPVTVSFWAKAATGTPSVTVFGLQNFGSSGSTAVFFGANNKQAITTSWVRYSFQLSVPSISGKTIAGGGDALRFFITTSAGTDRNAYTNSLGIQSATIDIWGVQAEYGSKATPFQTASGNSPQAELAMCQRYYQRITAASSLYARMTVTGIASSTTNVALYIPALTPMRTAPTSVEYAAPLAVYDSITPTAITALPLNSASTSTIIYVDATVASGLTQFRPYSIIANGSTSSYIGWSAEL
jgi:hypothetical protein